MENVNNDQAQAAACETPATENTPTGGLPAAPCSAPKMVLVRGKLVPDLSEEEHARADEMDENPDFIGGGTSLISCLDDFRSFESVIARLLAKNGGHPIHFDFSIYRGKKN